MQVIVTGGRHFKDKEMVARNLAKLNPTLVIEGGATGADRLAREWAKENGVEFKTVEAEWRKHGFYDARAGHTRNRKMIVDYPEAVVLHFPGNTGTKNCVETAKIMKRKVIKAE